MATGLPVVATRIGGTPRLVDHEATGLLVEPADASALAAAILRLIENPNAAAELGRRARQAVEDRFAVAAATRGVEELYGVLECR
jgi:glycosyltransferase involved in cell wall biosynthesis